MYLSKVFTCNIIGVVGHFGLIRPIPWMNHDDVDIAPMGQQEGQKHYCFENDVFVTNLTNTNSTFWTVGMGPPTGTAARPHGWRTPWEAPGFAPVTSPCGYWGGNKGPCCFNNWKQENGECAGGTWLEVTCPYGQLPRGEPCHEKDFPSKNFFTEWHANSTAVAGWGIMQNHGGGYAYRLCKMQNQDRSTVTEACMQQGHLKFGPRQWLKNRHHEMVEIPPAEVMPVLTEGTNPPGSEWRADPVAPCTGNYNGNGHQCSPPSATTGVGPQPPSVAPDLFGYGTSSAAQSGPQHDIMQGYMILDEVQVPDLEPGEYVLSWRWDAEQNPQVWLQCASIRILPPVSTPVMPSPPVSEPVPLPLPEPVPLPEPEPEPVVEPQPECNQQFCFNKAAELEKPTSPPDFNNSKWPHGCFQTVAPNKPHRDGKFWWNEYQDNGANNDKFESGKAVLVCQPVALLSVPHQRGRKGANAAMTVAPDGQVGQTKFANYVKTGW